MAVQFLPLMWNTYYFDSVCSNTVKNDMPTFGETSESFAHLITGFSELRILG